MTQGATMVLCKACKHEIPNGAVICKECKSAQGQQCWRCKHWLFPYAERCTACDSDQERRQLLHFPNATTVLALLAAIISVIASGVVPVVSYFRDYHSHTVIKVTGADENLLYFTVWNTGRKPSALVGYRLRSDDWPEGTEITLEPVADQQKTQSVIVPGGRPVIMSVKPPIRDSLPASLLAKQFPGEYIAEMRDSRGLDKMPLILEIDVQESDDDSGEVHHRSELFSAKRIEKFIPRLIP